MELTDRQLRAAALEAASRAVAPGSPSGHFLSTARMFETYIRSGISQVGPKFRQGVQAGRSGCIVRVEGDLSESDADILIETIDNLLTRRGIHASEATQDSRR